MWSETVEFAAIAMSKPRVDSKTRAYMPDIAVVPLLFAVVRNCHCYITEKQALHLLQTADRQEGLWHSGIAALVAARFLILTADEPATSFMQEASVILKVLRIVVNPHEEESVISI